MATRPRTPALETVVMVFLRSRQALRRRSLPSGPYTDEQVNSHHQGLGNLQQEHALRSTVPNQSPCRPLARNFLSAEPPRQWPKNPISQEARDAHALQAGATLVRGLIAGRPDRRSALPFHAL